jgi:hypothetical protein
MPDERDLPDIDNLRTVEEVIAWLREAAKTCAETARLTGTSPTTRYTYAAGRRRSAWLLVWWRMSPGGLQNEV